MRKDAIFLIAMAMLCGCSSSGNDTQATPAKPGEGVAQNPSGVPQTPDAKALDDKMVAAGQAQAAGQGAAAKAAADAAKAGK